jgi:hypothetical protein
MPVLIRLPLSEKIEIRAINNTDLHKKSNDITGGKNI